MECKFSLVQQNVGLLNIKVTLTSDFINDVNCAVHLWNTAAGTREISLREFSPVIIEMVISYANAEEIPIT